MQKRDGCKGKIRHRNKGGACTHLRKMKAPGMNAYRCKQCGGWHIGHSSRAAGIQSRLDRRIGPDPRTQTTP